MIKSRRGQFRIAGITFCVAAGLASLCWFALLRSPTLYHFQEVDAGKLYRSGFLSTGELKSARQRYGIKTIVNLCDPAADGKIAAVVDGENRNASVLGITFINIPLPTEEPPTREQLRQFMELATSPTSCPVLVHCEQGVVRTGMMMAAYQVGAMGLDAKTALDQMPLFGHSLEGKAPAVKMFILGLRSGKKPVDVTSSYYK